ncbi:MAG: hypothetical protein JWP95_1939 [Actinotalea sp.]|nr:hypothetical protein [Actinotalea sp.]
MDVPHRFHVTRGQVSAAKQAWLAAQEDGATSVAAILQGEVLAARSAWLESVDRGAPELESQALFAEYIALVASADVMGDAHPRRRTARPTA